MVPAYNEAFPSSITEFGNFEGVVSGSSDGYNINNTQTTFSVPAQNNTGGTIVFTQSLPLSTKDHRQNNVTYQCHASAQGTMTYTKPIPYGVKDIAVDFETIHNGVSDSTTSTRVYITDENGQEVISGENAINCEAFSKNYWKTYKLNIYAAYETDATVERGSTTSQVRIKSISLTY